MLNIASPKGATVINLREVEAFDSSGNILELTEPEVSGVEEGERRDGSNCIDGSKTQLSGYDHDICNTADRLLGSNPPVGTPDKDTCVENMTSHLEKVHPS